MKGQLTHWDCLHIEEILSDPILLKIWQMDGDKAKYVTVSMDGKITFGRTKYSWLNWIFKDTKEISFTDFAFKVANALAGQSKNRNEAIFKGISEVVLRKAIADNDYSYVVDALFDTFRYGWEGAASGSRFIDMRVIPKDLPSYEERKPQRRGSYQVGEVRLNSGESLGKIEIEYYVHGK